MALLQGGHGRHGETVHIPMPGRVDRRQGHQAGVLRSRGSAARMAEPVRTSPLAGFADRRPDRRRRRAGHALGAAVPRQADAARRRRSAQPCGAAFSAASCRARCAASAGGAIRALWLGPDEWLLLMAPDAVERHGGGAARGACRLASCRGRGQRPLDRVSASPARARATCSMPAARSTCIRGRSRPARRRGPCWPRRRSCCAGRSEADAFELYVNGSFAPYAWLFLENAAREFGFAVAA